MLSYQTQETTRTKEAVSFNAVQTGLFNAVSTNPKAISKLLSAAIVDRSFQKVLLTRPEEAMANGYNGEIFNLTEDDQAMIMTIQATSIKDFATQLVRLRENNCSGEWVVKSNYRLPAQGLPAVKPAWNMTAVPAS